MPIALIVRTQALNPVKRAAGKLSISKTTVLVWKIYTGHRYCNWLQKTWIRQNRALVRKNVRKNFPISYPASTKEFCLKPSLVYQKEIDSFPAILLPEVTFLWKLQKADTEQDLKILASTSISCLTTVR
ncbi:MAG: hypothetical protein ACFWTZ_03925 [Burkholderia sp.]|jgi:hypothetical protein